MNCGKQGFAIFFPLVANEMGVEFGLTSMATMPSSQSIFGEKWVLEKFAFRVKETP
jgi:hypothetical protein